MDGPMKILLQQGFSNTCSIIIFKKHNTSGDYCELMYLYDELKTEGSRKQP